MQQVSSQVYQSDLDGSDFDGNEAAANGWVSVVGKEVLNRPLNIVSNVLRGRHNRSYHTLLLVALVQKITIMPTAACSNTFSTLAIWSKQPCWNRSEICLMTTSRKANHISTWWEATVWMNHIWYVTLSSSRRGAVYLHRNTGWVDRLSSRAASQIASQTLLKVDFTSQLFTLPSAYTNNVHGANFCCN